MAIDPKHLRELVIQPACKAIGLWSVAAEELLLGTACQESKCGTFLKQIGKGPALGIFQMEPRTHDDLWKNFIGAHPNIRAGITHVGEHEKAEDMAWNLRYAAALARIHYYRVKEALPAAGDIPAQAAYWKKYYNTPKGAGTVEEYLNNYRRLA